MTTNCLLCGTSCHPGEIWLHLVEHHSFPWLGISQFIDMLIPLLEGPVDTKCSHCQMTYNAPEHNMPHARHATTEAHYRAQCPVAIQAAAILSAPLHGDHRGRKHGSFGTTPGSLPTPGSPVCPEPTGCGTPLQEAQGPAIPNNSDDHITKRPRTTRDAIVASPHTLGAPTGAGAAESPLSRQLCVPSLSGSGRDATAVDGGGGQMGQTRTQKDATESPPLSSHDPRTPAALHGSLHGQTRCSHLDGIGEEEHHSSGRRLANVGMESHEKAVRPRSEASNQDAGHEASGGRTSRDGHRSSNHPEVLQHATADRAEEYGGMATTTPPSMRPIPRGAGEAHQLHSMDAVWSHDETASTWAIQLDPTSLCLPWEQADQGEGQGKSGGHTEAEQSSMTLAERLRRVQLLSAFPNSQSWCYLNSVWRMIFWRTTAVSNFSPEHWGTCENQMAHLICQMFEAPEPIHDCRGFASLHRAWKDAWGSSQADASEFLAFLLAKLPLKVAAMAWQKRVATSEEIRCEDKSESPEPITLQLSTNAIPTTGIRIQDLIDAWQHAGGMMTAMVGSMEQCCFILDRGAQVQECGPIQKHMAPVNLEDHLEIPCFPGEPSPWAPYPSLERQTESHTHHIVAAIAHLGATIGGGHYRLALRMSVSPSVWALTEDDETPTIQWSLPEWFLTQTTIIWTARHDCIQWPLLPPGRQTAEDRLLQMLSRNN